MKTFKTINGAIDQLERDYKNNLTEKLNNFIEDLKSRGICRYNGCIYVVDEYDILK